MKQQKITTRGLSPLEIQVAELALAIKDIGETLPANLAKKYYTEVWNAASKASRYYIDISGRKNYLIEDIASFVKEFPENVLFTASDVHKRLNHNSSSIKSALSKLSTTDLELDLCNIDGYYIKSLSTNVRLNTSYRPDEGNKWLLKLKLEKELPSGTLPSDLLEVSKDFRKKAVELIRIRNKRLIKGDYGSGSHGELDIMRYLVREVVDKVAKEIFQRMQTTLSQDGFIDAYSFPQRSYYNGPDVLITSGNKRRLFELEIIDENVHANIYGSGNQVSFKDLEHYCLSNSGLVVPNEISGRPSSYYRYDPALLREVRKRKLDEKLSSREHK